MEIGTAKSMEMTIQIGEDKPFTYRPYRMSINEKEKVRTIIDDLLKADIIRESQSPYASPILLVKKKNGQDRMCVDFRKFNRQTIKDRFPLPRIDDQIDKLSGCKFFTTLDLASGYHQIPINERSKYLTSFVTPEGQYEYNRVPSGLCNAPSVFQRLMNKILGPYQNIAAVYLDDTLIATTTEAENLKNLKIILDVLRNEGLTLNLDKCNFLSKFCKNCTALNNINKKGRFMVLGKHLTN